MKPLVWPALILVTGLTAPAYCQRLEINPAACNAIALPASEPRVSMRGSPLTLAVIEFATAIAASRPRDTRRSR